MSSRWVLHARRSRSVTVVGRARGRRRTLGRHGAASATAATTRTIHPGDDVLAAMKGLHAGDTLLLAAGTYSTGYLRVTPMAAGTAAAPITIAAADPAHPPLLVGGLRFYSPMYLVLRSLRVQATSPGLSALVIDGGVGWTVDSSEFWGARQTNSMANVNISGTGGYPRAWSFTENCVHDAANSTRADQTDHNIYVSYEGSSATSGRIVRNVVWGAPHGENIKLGDGGVAGALGPWGVQVANNTLALGGRQVLLHADVRNNTIGNLLYRATQPFVSNPKTTQIYVHDVVGAGNTVVRQLLVPGHDAQLRPPRRRAHQRRAPHQRPDPRPRGAAGRPQRRAGRHRPHRRRPAAGPGGRPRPRRGRPDGPPAGLQAHGLRQVQVRDAQKAREARKNQVHTVIKEMKLRPKIDPHDYETKKGHVVRFLKAGRQGQDHDHVPRTRAVPARAGLPAAAAAGRGRPGARLRRVARRSRTAAT